MGVLRHIKYTNPPRLPLPPPPPPLLSASPNPSLLHKHVCEGSLLLHLERARLLSLASALKHASILRKPRILSRVHLGISPMEKLFEHLSRAPDLAIPVHLEVVGLGGEITRLLLAVRISASHHLGRTPTGLQFRLQMSVIGFRWCQERCWQRCVVCVCSRGMGFVTEAEKMPKARI